MTLELVATFLAVPGAAWATIKLGRLVPLEVTVRGRVVGSHPAARFLPPHSTAPSPTFGTRQIVRRAIAALLALPATPVMPVLPALPVAGIPARHAYQHYRLCR